MRYRPGPAFRAVGTLPTDEGDGSLRLTIVSP
jgi:hypothetical protein